MNAYSQDSFNNIQRDLKIFCGKKQEIASLQRNRKIVPYKIYLAQDTGEIFIANQAGKLVQYGASNELINAKVKNIIDRIDVVSETSNGLGNKINNLENNIDTLVNDCVDAAIERKLQSENVENQISDLIRNKIQLDNNFRQTLTTVVSDQGFVTETEVRNSLLNILQHKVVCQASGYNIREAIESATVGVYFCTSDYFYSDDFGNTYSFETGGFYEVYSTGLGTVNYRAIQIPNTVDDFITPNIVVNNSKILIPYGSTLENRIINYTIENYANVKEDTKLELRYITTETVNLFNDENETDDDNRPYANNTGTIVINKDVKVPYGESMLTLSGTDKSNSSFETYISVIGYAPLYYGTTNSNSISNVSNMSVVYNNDTNRTLTITTDNNDYLYILSDKIVNVYLDGVNVTNMFDITTLNIPSDIYTVEYKVYKSKITLSGETFTLDVRGN